jgi:hypothetical protein
MAAKRGSAASTQGSFLFIGAIPASPSQRFQRTVLGLSWNATLVECNSRGMQLFAGSLRSQTACHRAQGRQPAPVRCYVPLAPINYGGGPLKKLEPFQRPRCALLRTVPLTCAKSGSTESCEFLTRTQTSTPLSQISTHAGLMPDEKRIARSARVGVPMLLPATPQDGPAPPAVSRRRPPDRWLPRAPAPT